MAQKERREAEENFWDARRDANVRREEARWSAMEAAEEHQAQIEENTQESRSRKNAGSIPYDPVTLRYLSRLTHRWLGLSRLDPNPEPACHRAVVLTCGWWGRYHDTDDGNALLEADAATRVRDC